MFQQIRIVSIKIMRQFYQDIIIHKDSAFIELMTVQLYNDHRQIIFKFLI